MAPILDDASPADTSTKGWLLDKQYTTTLACLSMVLLPMPITIENQTRTLLLTSLLKTPVNKPSSDSSIYSDSFESVIPATL
ncbi:hypothetical protein HanIR_Chr04g0196101 [Helianthus annuus]|nr:hypothetical protein HanIR_Chr04g0196101 [Helianthus annuus]